MSDIKQWIDEVYEADIEQWVNEAQEVLDLVGDWEDTGSAEDQEFRKRAPHFMREALLALGVVRDMAQQMVEYGTDYDGRDFLEALDRVLVGGEIR